jgi:hypothetical protein
MEVYERGRRKCFEKIHRDINQGALLPHRTAPDAIVSDVCLGLVTTLPTPDNGFLVGEFKIPWTIVLVNAFTNFLETFLTRAPPPPSTRYIKAIMPKRSHYFGPDRDIADQPLPDLSSKSESEEI